MKRLSLILVLCFSVMGLTTGFIWSSRGVQKMSVRVSAKDLPNEGLLLFTPSDENFTNILAESGEALSAVEAVKPYSVVLRNSGKHPAVSFMLKWDLVRTDGIVLSRNFEYATAWALEGQGTNERGGYIVRPGSDWFFAPGFAIELKNLNAATISQGPAAHLTRIADDMSQFTSITVSLDGVFFDDGTFVGPNNTEFFEKVVALHKARRDVLEDLSMKTKTSKNRDDIFHEAESLAKQPKVKLGKKATTADYYDRFKADFADDVMKMKTISGAQKTLDYYLASLKREWPKLKKKY